MTAKPQPRIVRLKGVDFEVTSRVNPYYKGGHGMTFTFDDQAPEIHIDVNLPKVTRYGRRWVLFHEMAHVKVRDLCLEKPMGKWGEELYCDYEGLVRTENQYLHPNERAMKRLLLAGRRWSDLNGRREVIRDIVKMLKLTLTEDQILLLTNYQDRKIVRIK